MVLVLLESNNLEVGCLWTLARLWTWEVSRSPQSTMGISEVNVSVPAGMSQQSLVDSVWCIWRHALCFLENSIKSEAYTVTLCAETYQTSDPVLLPLFCPLKILLPFIQSMRKKAGLKTSSEHFLSLQLSLRLHYPGSTRRRPCLQCRRHKFDPWVGKIPGGGPGNPLQYSCLENPMDRGAWWVTVHGVTKSRTGLKWLCMHIHRAGKISKIHSSSSTVS